MRLLALLILAGVATAQPSVLEHAMGELRGMLPPLETAGLPPDEHAKQNARALESARSLHLLDVPVRVVSANGSPFPGIEVRALHQAFDLSAPMAVTDVRGEVTVRLPRGPWRIDLATHEPKAGQMVFARVHTGARDAGPIRIVVNQLRGVRFRGALGEARAAHVVSLAWPDFSFHKKIEVFQGQLIIGTVGNAPMILQAVRRPGELDPGYVLRRTVGPGRTIINPNPKGTIHSFTGKGVRTLRVRYSSSDALPLPIAFEAKDKREILFDGLKSVVLHLDLESGGRTYGFYPRPFDLDGKPRAFDGMPPFKASVGFHLNGDGRYKELRNSLSVRIFLLSKNDLMLRHDPRGVYTVDWEEVLDGKVRKAGSNKPPNSFMTPPVDPKRLHEIRYRLNIKGPKENRRVEVPAHGQIAMAKGGEVTTGCFPEVLPNANLWASAVSLAIRAYEETCPVNRHGTRIDRSIHMPGNLAGMGGWGGNNGWMWLPEGSVYGFYGPWYWTGLLSHELGHVHGYGHSNPAQNRIMQQAGRRAGRRLWAIRPGMQRAPEGNRYRALLEAVTRGETSVIQSFDDARDIPILRKTGEGHAAGDGVLTPNLEITGNDAVFLWYFRSMFGNKTDAERRKHAASWSWWLTLKGYSDPEIQIAMFSFGAKKSLAWLARMRGNMVYDHRIDAAVKELEARGGKFVWQRERGGIIHKWRHKRYAANDNLAEQEKLMRAELGHRWWRYFALREIAREYFTRREVAEAEAMLVKALTEARLGGEGMLQSAIAEAAPLWAAR
ncbi:MAG: hypothetical protein ACYTGZ_17815 [Planctomycetota bacterium]